VDVRRAPMASCFSGFKQLFAEGQEFSYDLTELGRYYRHYLATIRPCRPRHARRGSYAGL
jgi:hypothetical protein